MPPFLMSAWTDPDARRDDAALTERFEIERSAQPAGHVVGPEPVVPGSRLPTAEERLEADYAELDLIAAAEARTAAWRARKLCEISVQARRADTERGMPVHTDFIDLHVAGTLQVRQDEARVEVDYAKHLVLRLPRTWQALDQALIRPEQAELMTDRTYGLSAEQCALIEERLLPTMAGRSSGSLRRALDKLVKALRSQAEQQRERQRTLDARGVSGYRTQDGMAAVTATMPAGAQVLMMTALRQLAGKVKTAGDPRTLDQVMSDVLAAAPELLLAMVEGRLGSAAQAALAAHGFRPGSKTAPVEALLLVPITSALGQGTEPGDLRGYGPVAAEHARQLLLDARIRIGTTDQHGRIIAISGTTLDLRDPHWTEQLLPFQTTSETSTDRPAGRHTDDGLAVSDAERRWQQRLRQHLHDTLGPDAVQQLTDGLPLPDPEAFPDAPSSTGLPMPPAAEPQYRPSRRLARLIQARDLHCIGIGCDLPSRRCDLEHLLPYPHGPTSADNLSPVSRHCHRAKQAGWRYQRHPDGSTTWHAPHSQRSYTVQPDL